MKRMLGVAATALLGVGVAPAVGEGQVPDTCEPSCSLHVTAPHGAFLVLMPVGDFARIVEGNPVISRRAFEPDADLRSRLVMDAVSAELYEEFRDADRQADIFGRIGGLVWLASAGAGLVRDEGFEGWPLWSGLSGFGLHLFGEWRGAQARSRFRTLADQYNADLTR